uniref:Uncharacterized protein n=1 Tax=Oryza brachyantha TaxID=4533 RepID=J3MFU4_ORYBR
MKLKRKSLEVRPYLAAFSVNISMRVDPVEFGTEEAIMNEEIYSVGFCKDPTMPCHITPGRVTHDSPPFPFTPLGDLVVNKQAQLVGISCKNLGVTIALSVSSITKLLAMFVNIDMMGEPLSDILKCIKDKGKSLIKGKKRSGSKKRKKNSC